MQNRTDILNFLVETCKLNSYCEIGTQNRKSNFDKILAPFKYCVDPDPAAKADFIGTSDEYFAQNTAKFDLFFIDGLHHAEQVYKDFRNALNVLNQNGFIVFHDMLPVHELHAKVPRESKIWNGDVYRLAFLLKENYSNLKLVIVNIDHGCGVLWKKPFMKDEPFTVTKEEEYMVKYDWNYYTRNRPTLPIVSPEEFKGIIDPFK